MTGKHARHLFGRLQIHFARTVVALFGLLERKTGLDARQVEVCLGVGSIGVVNVVGGDQWQRELAREVDENAVQYGLFGEAVVLQLDIQASRFECVAQRCKHLAASALPLFEDRLRHEPAHASGQAHAPFCVARKVFERDHRLPGRSPFDRRDMTTRDQPDEVFVSLELAARRGR